ncbi:hypothetical protein BJY17_000800 [Agromyces hippuratus]|uniref:Exo-alpha-sialidase n=1 Tax=Agromyces hippuratus TaxID=286438 RepID=A0A852WVR2_9MICO|nr:exo-alpha-sialidase [Agromyces hippuratus]NYG20053.1 hypothetical protein [Agromyces hippuratus]
MIDQLRIRRAAVYLALAGGLAMVLAACTADANPIESPAATVGHVHGLGADPSTGQTYAATHTGVWLLPTTDLPSTYPAVDSVDVQAPVQIAERWQDTMGFTVARPGLLLGSGHPDLVEQPDLDPPNLGLISSTDGAMTWESVSLRGEVDFHDLDAVELPDGQLRIYGYDATAATVKASSDSGATWSEGAALELRDLATDPAAPDRVYATTARGLMVSNDRGESFLPVPNAPALYLLTLTHDTGQFIGVDAEGTVWTSDDGATWSERGQTAGVPEALAYVGGDAPWILIADERGVVATDDYGATATILLTMQG